LASSKLLEGGEQDALKLDGQRQQPVEEGGDRRQLVLDAVVVHQLQAGGGLEALERAALDLAAHEQEIELAQRIAGIGIPDCPRAGTGPGRRSGAGRA
jgi:hypothetical protein